MKEAGEIQVVCRELQKVFEKLTAKEVEKILVPPFKIPSWPPLTITLVLGEKEFFLPILQPRVSSGDAYAVYTLETRTDEVVVAIENTGAVKISMSSMNITYASTDSNHRSRLSALFVLYQFRKEIFSRIFKKFKRHNQVARRTQKMFSAFVPYVVAEELGKTVGGKGGIVDRIA